MPTTGNQKSQISENRARLTLLGCGTSTGVPMPGCSCAVCTSGDPKNFRNRTSAYIKTAQGKGILIDASPDLRHQAISYHVDCVDAVLFTHAHADHILGIEDLRCYNFKTRQSIPCFGTAFTLSRIRHVFDYIFSPDPSYEGGMLAQLDGCEFVLGKPFVAANLSILPLLLEHGRMAVAGFRIGELGYATDCNQIPEASIAALKGCKYLFLDALRSESHRTHFTLSQAIVMAQKIGAERTIFIHMAHSIDYHTASAQLPPGIELGYDGLEIEFSTVCDP